MTFHERLREAREKAGLSQQEVAKSLGISRSSLNMYERGERDPNTQTLSLLAKLYNVSVDWLLGHTDTPRPFGSGEVRSGDKPDLEDLAKRLRGAGATDEEVAAVIELLERRRRFREITTMQGDDSAE